MIIYCQENGSIQKQCVISFRIIYCQRNLAVNLMVVLEKWWKCYNTMDCIQHYHFIKRCKKQKEKVTGGLNAEFREKEIRKPSRWLKQKK